jgi:predicted N-acetyltransferase YhbS
VDDDFSVLFGSDMVFGHLLEDVQDFILTMKNQEWQPQLEVEMTTTFERARAEDFDEIVDLANYVFSHSNGRVDFPSLLPKLYREQYGTAGYHCIAREAGHIRAIVGAFPIPMDVAGDRLLVCGIGTVCVHPYRRNTGYMKALMQMAHDGMAASGADFGCLGGQRQRYQYFGYDLCGQMFHFTLNKTNVRHCYGRDYAPTYRFRRMDAEDPAMATCLEWFNRRPAHAVRELNRFYDTVCSWNFLLWGIEQKGKLIGYLTAAKNGEEVHELVTADDNDAAGILSDWLVTQGFDQVQFVTPPYDQKGIASLSAICESMHLSPAHNMAVFNFPNTVRAFAKLKASYETLPEGRLVLAVEGRKPFRIVMHAGTVTVEETDEPANLELPYMGALACLFGPFSGITTPIYESICKAGPAGWSLTERTLARVWFPLPLFFEESDNV